MQTIRHAHTSKLESRDFPVSAVIHASCSQNWLTAAICLPPGKLAHKCLVRTRLMVQARDAADSRPAQYWNDGERTALLMNMTYADSC
jgi:hypothetical protein